MVCLHFISKEIRRTWLVTQVSENSSMLSAASCFLGECFFWRFFGRIHNTSSKMWHALGACPSYREFNLVLLLVGLWLRRIITVNPDFCFVPFIQNDEVEKWLTITALNRLYQRGFRLRGQTWCDTLMISLFKSVFAMNERGPVNENSLQTSIMYIDVCWLFSHNLTNLTKSQHTCLHTYISGHQSSSPAGNLSTLISVLSLSSAMTGESLQCPVRIKTLHKLFPGILHPVNILQGCSLPCFPDLLSQSNS